MKQSTLCLLSGVAGALFAVACGAVDGLSKDANATDVLLTKHVEELSCYREDGSGFADELNDFYERASNAKYIFSLGTNSSEDCYDDPEDSNGDGDLEWNNNNTFEVWYIK